MARQKALAGKTLAEVMALDIKQLDMPTLREATQRLASPANKRARRAGGENVISTKGVTNRRELERIFNRASAYLIRDQRKKETAKAKDQAKRKVKKEKAKLAERKKREAEKVKRAEKKKTTPGRRTETRAEIAETKKFRDLMSKNPNSLSLKELKEASEFIKNYMNKKLKQDEAGIVKELKTEKFDYKEDNPYSMRRMWMRALTFDESKRGKVNVEKAWSTLKDKEWFKKLKGTESQLARLRKGFDLYDAMLKEHPEIFAQKGFKYEVADIVVSEMKRNYDYEELLLRMDTILEKAQERIAVKEAEAQKVEKRYYQNIRRKVDVTAGRRSIPRLRVARRKNT